MRTPFAKSPAGGAKPVLWLAAGILFGVLLTAVGLSLLGAQNVALQAALFAPRPVARFRALPAADGSADDAVDAVADAARGQSPPDAAAAAAAAPPSQPPSPAPRVMYLVRTCPKYYGTRLTDALSTYLAEVPAPLVLLVGNTAHTQTAPDHTRGLRSPDVRNMSVMPTDGVGGGGGVAACPDNHEDGVTCVEGRGLFYAYERRHLFDWLFVVDDDVYAHRHNIELTVRELRGEDPHVFTVGGCGFKAKCANEAGGGICGGGGYLLSRQNLERAVCGDGLPGGRAPQCNPGAGAAGAAGGQSLEPWMRSWMGIGAEIQREDGSWWSDITAGCAFHRRGGIRTKQLPGLHPWTVAAKDLIQKLANDAPLSFHYVHRDEMPGMRGMHKLVAGTHRNATANGHRVVEEVAKMKR